MSKQEIIHAYRKLYRSGLRAVQYSKPARYSLQAQLRAAFREPGATFNAEGCRRTVWFFNAAAQEAGLEHRILRNLLRVAHMRRKRGDSWAHISRTKPKPPYVRFLALNPPVYLVRGGNARDARRG